MSEPAKVVGLDGKEILAFPGEPIPEVVEVLEEMLAKARVGEISSLMASYVIEDGTDKPMTGWRTRVAPYRREMAYFAAKRMIRDFENDCL